MLVAGSCDGKGEGMTEQDIMEVISEVNQRVANVEKERTAEQVTFRLAIKRLTRLIGQLGEDHAAEAELIQFAADSKDIDILKERLVQINSFGLRNIEEPRLFIDMDGTLAKFQTVDTLEKLYEKGYFYNLPPNENVVEAIRNIINNHPEKEVYILSAVLSDSKYAKAEKDAWLNKYLPEIDAEHRIYPPCGDSKLAYVPGGIRTTDFLLDDYTHNLILWEPPAKGIKLLNGINHTRGTWQGSMLRFDKKPEQLAADIVKVIEVQQIFMQTIEAEKRKMEDLKGLSVLQDVDGGEIILPKPVEEKSDKTGWNMDCSLRKILSEHWNDLSQIEQEEICIDLASDLNETQIKSYIGMV